MPFLKLFTLLALPSNLARLVIIAGLIALWTTGAILYGEQRQKAKVAQIQAVLEKEAGDKAIKEFKDLQIREEELQNAPPKCKLDYDLMRVILGMCKRQHCA